VVAGIEPPSAAAAAADASSSSHSFLGMVGMIGTHYSDSHVTTGEESRDQSGDCGGGGGERVGHDRDTLRYIDSLVTPGEAKGARRGVGC
jgi:hypothetical protein